MLSEMEMDLDVELENIRNGVIAEIISDMHRYDEPIPPSLMRWIKWDYVAIQDVLGYPECPPISWNGMDSKSLEIPVKQGTKLFLTYFDEATMQFTTEAGVDVVFHRDWTNSPTCDYQKYFNLPIGIQSIKR